MSSAELLLLEDTRARGALASLFSDADLDLVYQVVVPVLKARVLLHVRMVLAELSEAVVAMGEVLDERVVLGVEDLQLHLSIG